MPRSLLNETDVEILSELDDGNRNVAANVAMEIDADRSDVNTRFSQLRNERLVERVGPHAQSGLYEITAKGEVVVEHRDVYESDAVDDVETVVETRLDDR